MPNPTRRGGTRWLLVGLAALACGCRGLFAVPEPLRIDNWQDLDETGLGLVAGRTTVQDAQEAMRRHGLTGLRTDTFVGEGGAHPRMVSALAADFQSRVFLFEENRFRAALRVPSGGVLPFGYALRLGRAQDRLLLLALYRDPRDLVPGALGQGPRVDVFAEGADGFEFVKRVPLASLSAANQGLTSPYFVGHDLGEGVMFLARDRDGALWDTAMLLTVRGSELVLAPLPMEEAARCSCVQRYVYAARAEDVWQE